MFKKETILFILLLAAVLLVACSSSPAAAVAPTPTVLTEKAIGKSLLNCPVTLPPDPPFRAPEPYPPLSPNPGTFWYGTPGLWTMLPDDGIWQGLSHTEEDGQPHWTQKVFFWHEGYDGSLEPVPELTLEGEYLYDASRTFTSPDATNAHHPSFGWAMLTGADLPSWGCWQLTAAYQGHELTFVVWVDPQ